MMRYEIRSLDILFKAIQAEIEIEWVSKSSGQTYNPTPKQMKARWVSLEELQSGSNFNEAIENKRCWAVGSEAFHICGYLYVKDDL